MKHTVSLNHIQSELVASNLPLVHYAIQLSAVVNKAFCGLEYEDLFQEGCVLLCRAALKYRPEKNIVFSTFATAVMINGLRTYCQRMYNKQKRLIRVPNGAESEEHRLTLDRYSSEYDWEQITSSFETTELLYALKQQYSGTARLGIEAIEWKTKGYSGTEIAEMYGVKPNLVGAWISRAARKLEQNNLFLSWKDEFYKPKVSKQGS